MTSGVGCAGHTLALKGLRGCGVNITRAAVGSTLAVRFMVFDDASPARNASVSRTLTVVSPCTTEQFLCADDSCSNIACALRDSLACEYSSTPRPYFKTLLKCLKDPIETLLNPYENLTGPFETLRNHC